MKRTKHIDLGRMRKGSASFIAKPLALVVAAYTLSACSSKEEAVVVGDPQECIDKTELSVEECEMAYKQALQEAARTAPKYGNIGQCESEFGHGGCVPYTGSDGGGWFMPAMLGFLVADALDDLTDRRDRGYGYYNPVFGYNRPYSRYHNRIMTADGTVLGGRYDKKIEVERKQLTSRKPAVKKTISRGGFGAKASAKANWGGGSRYSGGGRRGGGWGG